MPNIFAERREEKKHTLVYVFCLILEKKSFLEYLLYVSPWLINAYAVMVLYAVIRGEYKKNKQTTDLFHLVD